MDRNRWIAMSLLGCLMAGGCERRTQPQTTAVPPPLQAVLPQSISLHPFTDTRSFTDAGDIDGIEVRLQAFDAFGDATKAFGEIRLELFSYRPHEADPRGERLAAWRIDLNGVEENRRYWKSLSRMYEFPIALDRPMPVGERFVLAAVLENPYGPRLFARRIFVAGE